MIDRVLPGQRSVTLALMLGLVALFVAIAALLLADGRGSTIAHASAPAPLPPAQATAGSATIHHYEYVFGGGGSMTVYDIDNAQQVVQQVSGLPDTPGVRGVMVNPATHTLYVSHGGDGGEYGDGALLAYDLVSGTVLWNRSYKFPVDSAAITPDGKTIYLPSGENESSGLWNVLDASDGEPTGTIQGGAGAHNTLVSLDGKDVFLAGRDSNYLDVASTATNKVIQRIGPLSSGVRPFTVNGADTLAYTTATNTLGFQVSSITSGHVLTTVGFPGFTIPSGFASSAPSHGITLTPNERQLYVMDGANARVHVYDVSGAHATAPSPLATIVLSSMAGSEVPCGYDCGKSGWLQASRDGRFVYVGDSGDVIDTQTLEIVATLPELARTREYLEIDWADGVPVATTSRYGLGYVTPGTPLGEAPGGGPPAEESPGGGTPPEETPGGGTPREETPGGGPPAEETGAGGPPAGETGAGNPPAGEKRAGIPPAGETPAGGSPPGQTGAATSTAGQASPSGALSVAPQVSAGVVIDELSLSPRVFTAASDGASVGGESAGGTTVAYRASEPGSTRFTVLTPESGLQSARGVCLRGARGGGRRMRHACTGYVSVGSFVHANGAGLNHLRFSGRVGGHKLKPGRYRLEALPLAGARGATAAFRVLP